MGETRPICDEVMVLSRLVVVVGRVLKWVLYNLTPEKITVLLRAEDAELEVLVKEAFERCLDWPALPMEGEEFVLSLPLAPPSAMMIRPGGRGKRFKLIRLGQFRNGKEALAEIEKEGFLPVEPGYVDDFIKRYPVSEAPESRLHIFLACTGEKPSFRVLTSTGMRWVKMEPVGAPPFPIFGGLYLVGIPPEKRLYA